MNADMLFELLHGKANVRMIIVVERHQIPVPNWSVNLPALGYTLSLHDDGKWTKLYWGYHAEEACPECKGHCKERENYREVFTTDEVIEMLKEYFRGHRDATWHLQSNGEFVEIEPHVVRYCDICNAGCITCRNEVENLISERKGSNTRRIADRIKMSVDILPLFNNCFRWYLGNKKILKDKRLPEAMSEVCSSEYIGLIEDESGLTIRFDLRGYTQKVLDRLNKMKKKKSR